MQLIFVVETSKESQSDYVYVSETIEKYYHILGHKLTPIFMSGKGNYNKKEDEIRKCVSKYKGDSVIFICYDIDNPNKPTYSLNQDIFNYAKDKGYELIWFYEDVELVYWKKEVSKSEKTKYSKKFLSQNKIDGILEKDLNQSKISQKNSSNILSVLDKYLRRK